MWWMSSDLDQQFDVNPIPLGIPEVRGDLDQQIDVTPVSLGIPQGPRTTSSSCSLTFSLISLIPSSSRLGEEEVKWPQP